VHHHGLTYICCSVCPAVAAAPPPHTHTHLQGRLNQLAIAQAGLICPRGLPPSLAQLEALVTLDLAFNFINMTAEDMAQVHRGGYSSDMLMHGLDNGSVAAQQPQHAGPGLQLHQHDRTGHGTGAGVGGGRC
jgi:hypothetical protein